MSTPKMTQGHFVMIAKILETYAEEPVHGHLVHSFVVRLREINPKFSEKLFRLACGEHPATVASILASKRV